MFKDGKDNLANFTSLNNDEVIIIRLVEGGRNANHTIVLLAPSSSLFYHHIF